MKLTNGYLLELYRQVMELKREGGIIVYLLRSKISQWEKDNMVRVNGILERLKEIDMEYWQHTVEGGEVKFTKVDGDDGKQEPVLIEGKKREDYDALFSALINEETTMIL